MNYLLLLLFALVTSCIYAKEVPNGDVASAARLASSVASSSVLPSASPLQLNYVPLDKIKNHSPLIIGETHGTQEVLLFLAKLIKSAQTNSESMAVLLELPADLNPLIDQYLKGQLTQPALMRHPFWSRKIQDGRSSQAIMDFLRDVRAARENDVSIEVYAYDRKRDGSQQGVERELIMFENVYAYLSANQADRFVIVTGRVHARKSLVFDGGVRSLANQLSDMQRVTSLNMVAKKGSYWVCFAHPVKTFDCGVKEVQNKKGVAAQYQHGEGVYLFSKACPDYDGELYFDSVRFSPPVKTPAQ